MKLKLYNSLNKYKSDFTPLDEKRVTMYNCGPTVYSYAHIGNARAAVVADVLFRVLRHIYGEDHVVYARNITDVDDKIIETAKEQGVDISVITEKYAKIYNDDLAAIGCLPPTEQPKCTAHIDGMVEMISNLMDKGFAYESDGHVFFDVSKYDDYGSLSENNLDTLRSGSRVEVNEISRKRNVEDFVLWKPELDGIGWNSELGKGRPGWHIECSAMIKDVLGDTIDIHCGGVDLKFPHHENEIAQSQCANNKPLANYWVHNEFLNMGKEKMSKSLGNVKLIHDLLKDWDGEVIRLALLKAHYRKELVWTEDLLKESKAQLDRWYRSIENHDGSHDLLNNQELYDILLDDLNTPNYISMLSLICDEAFNQTIHKNSLINYANMIGLMKKSPEEWKNSSLSNTDIEIYDKIALEREKARAHKDWEKADCIREYAESIGLKLEDIDGKTIWRKA